MATALTFTLAEAAQILDPPMTEAQLHAIIVDGLGWQPDGYRHTGRPGRPAACYDATRLMELHAAVTPFGGNTCLNVPDTSCPDPGGPPWLS